MKKFLLLSILTALLIMMSSCSLVVKSAVKTEDSPKNVSTSIKQSTAKEAVESFVKAMIAGDESNISLLNRISTTYMYDSDLYEYSYDYFQNHDAADFPIETKESGNGSYAFSDCDEIFQIENEEIRMVIGVKDIGGKYYINAMNVYT